jgi:hypothetical protein
MSAIRAVLFVMCDQRRHDCDSACGASPVQTRIPACAGRPGSVRGVRIGMW